MATTLVQEPYNLFAMQKMAGYPSAQPQQIQQLQQAQPPIIAAISMRSDRRMLFSLALRAMAQA